MDIKVFPEDMWKIHVSEWKMKYCFWQEFSNISILCRKAIFGNVECLKVIYREKLDFFIDFVLIKELSIGEVSRFCDTKF